jgi:2,3-bisphosphoglycerate-dependent phosphoglycerate mutase
VIILIRHAESAPDFTLPERDWPLTARGHAQAETLVERLAEHRIDRIYASPYIRAIDTVRPLATRRGLAVELVDDLRERKLVDGFAADFAALVERSFAEPDFALPGCESAAAAQRRVVAAIAPLARADQTIAIGSHGQLISLFLNARDPGFGFAQWQAMPFPDVIIVP